MSLEYMWVVNSGDPDQMQSFAVYKDLGLNCLLRRLSVCIISVNTVIIFSYFTMKTYVVEMHLNHLCKVMQHIKGPDKRNNQGPVVQSIVSLTSSLRVISLTVLADLIHNILIFFAEKMWVAFALQKLLTFFQQKFSAYLRITRLKF